MALRLWAVSQEMTREVYVVAEDEKAAILLAERCNEEWDDGGAGARALTAADLAGMASYADKHPERYDELTDYVPYGGAFFQDDPDLSVLNIARRLTEQDRKEADERAVRDANMKLFEGCDPQPLDKEVE